MLTILLSQQASANLSAIDWSTLIVGILSFVGIIITLLVNNSQNKKLEKIEKESFEDEFSRNLITNSRNEWLKIFKEDLSKFLACMMNYSDIAWHEKVDDKLLAAKLLNKIKFYLNPNDQIDEDLFKLIQLAYDDFDALSTVSENVNKTMELHLEQVVFEIQQFSACLFKTEWERIKHHAKHGENTKFNFKERFQELYKNVTQYELL